MLRFLLAVALLAALAALAIATGHDHGFWQVMTGRVSYLVPTEPPHPRSPEQRHLKEFAPREP